MKTKKNNRKFAYVLRKFAREKLNALVKKLLNFKIKKPKRDFV